MDKESELIWESYKSKITESMDESEILDAVRADPFKYTLTIQRTPDKDWEGNDIEREEGYVYLADTENNKLGYVEEGEFIGRIWGEELEEIEDIMDKACPMQVDRLF